MLQVEDMIIVTSISKQFCNFLLADNKTDKNTTLYIEGPKQYLETRISQRLGSFDH